MLEYRRVYRNRYDYLLDYKKENYYHYYETGTPWTAVKGLVYNNIGRENFQKNYNRKDKPPPRTYTWFHRHCFLECALKVGTRQKFQKKKKKDPKKRVDIEI